MRLCSESRFEIFMPMGDPEGHESFSSVIPYESFYYIPETPNGLG